MYAQKDVSLAGYTTFKIGGGAKYFIDARNKEDIVEAVRFAKEKNLPFFIIGAGSNVLASDEGYEGVIIKINNTEYKIHGTEIAAGAGAMLKDLVAVSCEASLTGLEWAAGIPGTIGGAVFGNARAFEGKTEDAVKKVECFDVETEEIKRFNKEECGFSEKQSVFKANNNLVILSVILELKNGNKEDMEKLIKDHLEKRKQRHPLELGSAGSVFVNRPGDEPSSYLIEKAGLKGLKVGDAQVSEKHAGFIVNLGKATSKDVIELIALVKKTVKDKLGVELKEEIRVIKS